MPIRKIADAPELPCRNPEHRPPNMIVLEPGTYEYTCPGCGQKVIFTVPRVFSLAAPENYGGFALRKQQLWSSE